MKLNDLLCDMVVEGYDQNKRSLVLRPIVLVVGCLPRPRRIQHGKLMWQNCDQLNWSLIRISPVQFGVLHGPSPTIQPFYNFFPVNFWSASWAKPNIAAFFIIGPWPFVKTNLVFLFFPKEGSTSQVGPGCQVHV